MARIKITIYRHSKAATAVSILSNASVMFCVGCIVAIFRGYKTEGIWGTIISLVLAVFFAFAAARIAKSAETPKPPLERRKNVYKICRIAHYAILAVMLASFILSFITHMNDNANDISNIFSMIAAFAIFVYFPVMITFIIVGIRLKTMQKRVRQEQPYSNVDAPETTD